MTLKPPLVAGPRNPQQSPEGIAVNALRLVPVLLLPSAADEGTLVVLQSTGEVYRRSGAAWHVVGSSGGGGGGGADGSYVNPDYPALTTVTAALDFLLEVPFAASGMSVSPSVVEIGSTVSSVSLAWGWSKVPDSQSMLGPGSIALLPSGTAAALSGLTVTGDTTWTVTGLDGTTSVPQTASLRFDRRRFWGPSADASFTPEVLPSSDLGTARQMARTLSCTAQYLCFAWPASFGVPRFYVGGFLNTAWEERIAPYTNAFGHTEDYRMYRSTYLQNGAGIEVEVK